MMPGDPLSQLRDIHLPATGGFWPPAPGWWILAFTLLAAAAILAWALHRRRRSNRWLHFARAELADLERNAMKSTQWFARVNALLKRVARDRYPDDNPEALSGEHWVDFLLAHLPADRIAQQPVAEALVNSAWQPEPSAEPRQVLDFARTWLEAQKC